jgi:hypothetical protein
MVTGLVDWSSFPSHSLSEKVYLILFTHTKWRICQEKESLLKIQFSPIWPRSSLPFMKPKGTRRGPPPPLQKKNPATFPCLDPEESTQSPPNFVFFSSLQFVLYIPVKLFSSNYPKLGPAVAQWLRCCATNRKVAVSIPAGVIGIFHWHNPSDCTMALGSTQPLTEMSTRCISCGVKAAGA